MPGAVHESFLKHFLLLLLAETTQTTQRHTPVSIYVEHQTLRLQECFCGDVRLQGVCFYVEGNTKWFFF